MYIAPPEQFVASHLTEQFVNEALLMLQSLPVRKIAPPRIEFLPEIPST